MTPGDWIAAGSALFTAAAVGGGALYMRGKLDGLQTAMDRRLGLLEQRVQADDEARTGEARERGAQRLRNRMLDSLAAQAGRQGVQLGRLETGLERHEAECQRRQQAIEARFERIDHRLELMNGAVLGQAQREPAQA